VETGIIFGIILVAFCRLLVILRVGISVVEESSPLDKGGRGAGDR